MINMLRHLLFLLFIGVCVFHSQASQHHHQEAAKSANEDAKVINTDQIEDQDDHGDDDDMEKSSLDLDEDEDDDDDDDDDMEDSNRDLDEDYDNDRIEDDLPAYPLERGAMNPILDDIYVRSRRPACSNRKCRRWYKGWWANSSDNPNARAVAYCEKTDLYCWAICYPRNWCIKRGGECKFKDQCAITLGYRWRSGGCRGRWGCCYMP